MSLIKKIKTLFKNKNYNIKRLDKDAFRNIISQKKGYLIDVRTALEFNQGHIKNAKNIDFYNRNKFVSEINKLNKNKPVYLYCRSGVRSYKAAKVLSKLGFTEIYDLKGGILRWN